MKKVLFLSLLTATTVFAQKPKTLTIRIDLENKAQQIDNFGAAGAWFTEGIVRNWPAQNREQMAEWLFSKEFNANGQPKGIGLSSWRFNIGGGTAEQGDSSAFSNTPPVQLTKNGRGYKTTKDYISNLKPEHYGDYAGFLATVLKHFDGDGLHFNYISPVNEPQWDWSHPPGQGAKQEGSPWRNDEIAHVARSLDSALTATGSTSKILLTEAAQLDYLYAKTGNANQQTQTFFDPKSKFALTSLPNLPRLIGGHSYFTDKGDSARIAIRRHVADTTAKYGVTFWQTEYSMLADGYREGKTGRIPAIDCALFLSKVIHDDLVYGNAAAWQLWNSWEPGNPDFDTRYYLIALNPSSREYIDGTITATKNLWALGHYSRFIRPGMHRLHVGRSDKLPDVAIAQDVMVSAFASDKQVVLVAINYTDEERVVRTELNGLKARAVDVYLTTGERGVNMQYSQLRSVKDGIKIPARSIMTVVLNYQ